MPKVTLVEMGLRDGLQNEAVHLDLSQRYQFFKKLTQAGLKRIEAGAFVSPKWVPQMADTAKLVKRIQNGQARKQLSQDIQISALVPNHKGYLNSQKAGLREVAIFGAASETFSKKNINCTVKQSLVKFTEVCQQAKKDKVKVRAYLSTVFACPYEGRISEKAVLRLIDKYMQLGVSELSLGDTIGVASPKQVRSLLSQALKVTSHKKIALHFHDTRGTAVANILASLDMGFRTFDTSIGGLGGCPYAPGAAGNVATEDVAYMLNEMGFETGLDLTKLVKTTHWLVQQLGRPLPAKLSHIGMQKNL